MLCDYFGEYGVRMLRKEIIFGIVLYLYGCYFIVVGFIFEGNLIFFYYFLILDVVMVLEFGIFVFLYVEKGYLLKV